MKIAAYQMSAKIDGTENRLRTMESILQESSENGIELVVFPELATSGYGIGRGMHSIAQPIEGEITTRLSNLSCKFNLPFVTGLPIKEDNAVTNSALFFDAEGQFTRHDKVHLYGEYEKDIFAPGEHNPTLVKHNGIVFGILICFEVEFPERVRELTTRGAEVILVPTALPKCHGSEFIAQKMIPVRAFENQCFIVYADHCESEQEHSYQGCSCIVAPDGQMLASTISNQAELLYAEIHPNYYTSSKKENPYLEELNDFRGAV